MNFKKSYVGIFLIMVPFVLCGVHQDAKQAILHRLSDDEVRTECIDLLESFNELVGTEFDSLLAKLSNKVPDYEEMVFGFAFILNDPMLSVSEMNTFFNDIESDAVSEVQNVASLLNALFEMVTSEYKGIRRITMYRGIFGDELFSDAQAIKNKMYTRLAYYKVLILHLIKQRTDKEGVDHSLYKALVNAYKEICNNILKGYLSFEDAVHNIAHNKGSFIIASMDNDLSEFHNKKIVEFEHSLRENYNKVDSKINKNVDLVNFILGSVKNDVYQQRLYSEFIRFLMKENEEGLALFHTLARTNTIADSFIRYFQGLGNDYKSRMVSYFLSNKQAINFSLFVGKDSEEIKKEITNQITQANKFFIMQFGVDGNPIDAVAKNFKDSFDAFTAAYVDILFESMQTRQGRFNYNSLLLR